jgi:hypothetical protein
VVVEALEAGFSSSLPGGAVKALRKVRVLKNVKMFRPGCNRI